MQIRCSSCFHEYEEAFGMCPNCGYVEGESSEEIYSLSPGTIVQNRFLIGGVVGVGGFGITYRVWDMQHETILAIKEYFPASLATRAGHDPVVRLAAQKRAAEFEWGKRRFLDEARYMAKFNNHHNIVNVFNYFEENNTAYIVMEYLDGMTLSQTMKTNNASLPVDRCVSIAIDICDALESIHKADVLHRDVSPDNIMLCRDGTVKLLDFGAARFSADPESESRITVVVKPGFAPPEQYENVNQQDARTDIYALGATMYYALTSVKPDESTDRKRNDDLKNPKSFMPEIPDYVDRAIMRAMALDPQYRFENADAFRKVLRQKIEVSTVSDAQKKRKRIKLGILAAAMATVLAAFTIFWMSWMQQKVPSGSVELWYMTSASTAEAEETAWKSIAAQFAENHPDVKVNAVGIDEAAYAEKLAEAQKNGTMPDIYESTNLPDALMVGAQSLEQLLEDSRNVYLEGLGDKDVQYPTGMVLPVIYVNSSIASIRETASIAEMVNACQDQDSVLLVSESAAQLYGTLYQEDLTAYASADALNQFVNGKCLMYLGTSADFLAVQEMTKTARGMYTILFPDTDSSAYTYGCLWSCGKMDQNTQKIAYALLEYLNTDRAQDYFNIRNFKYSSCVPVTDSAVSRYVEAGFSEMKQMIEFLDKPYAE